MSRNLSTRLSRKLEQHLVVGDPYNLDKIAELLEMQLQAAMRKGVLNRSGENVLVLLITLERRTAGNQYYDHIDNDVLYWEGQRVNRFAEQYMETGEYEIFIFLRPDYRMSYTYYGKAIPIAIKWSEPGTPCKTQFSLYQWGNTDWQTQEMIANPKPLYAGATTQTSLIKQRTVAQQKFREGALRLWDNQCAVLGVDEKKILIASHIKPWRVAQDQERVDPKNSLILSPLYDKLFDLGMISFRENDGNIVLSKQISNNHYDRLGIDDSKRLRWIPDGVDSYLTYHKEYVFDYAPSIETELKKLIV